MRRTDAFTIQRLMGHADIATTALYIADRPDVQRAAVKEIGAMLSIG